MPAKLTEEQRYHFANVVKAALREHTDTWRFSFTAAVDASFDVYQDGRPIFKVVIKDPSPTGYEGRREG